MSSEPRLVEVRKNVLKQNDVIAHALRERFRQAGVLAVSLVSSPGSGKTAFFGEDADVAAFRVTGWRHWSATSQRKMMPPAWLAARSR